MGNIARLGGYIEMKRYLVIWEIDIEADSAEEAVREAVELLDETEAAIWTFVAVDDETKERTTVELVEPENLFVPNGIVFG
jgi:hypothetical protein